MAVDNVLPRRNLPGGSENWGREIEKRVFTAERAVPQIRQRVLSNNRTLASRLPTLYSQFDDGSEYTTTYSHAAQVTVPYYADNPPDIVTTGVEVTAPVGATGVFVQSLLGFASETDTPFTGGFVFDVSFSQTNWFPASFDPTTNRRPQDLLRYVNAFPSYDQMGMIPGYTDPRSGYIPLASGSFYHSYHLYPDDGAQGDMNISFSAVFRWV